jgi:hypothetical protein
MTKLEDKARELGFQIKKGPTKFSGYLLKRLNVSKQAAETKSNRARKATVDYLIDDDELQVDEYELQIDEYPIGSDYKWGLAYIEDWLDAHAADIAAGRVKASDDGDAEPEVETGVKRPKVKPPAPASISKALRDHSDAKEIKELMKCAKVSDPTGPKTLHDLQIEVRAHQSRQNYNPAWNIVAGHEIHEGDEADGGRALREYLAEVERENRNSPPPDPNWSPEAAMPMPTDMSDVQVVKVKRRVSRKL